LKSAFQSFFKRPTTWVGLITALMFQVIFSVIWMTGYNGVSDNTNKLKIAVVNEDQQLGAQVAAGLLQSLPFDVVQADSLDQARGELNERKLHMIVYIPGDFSARAVDGQSTAAIQYLINESNPALTKSIMNGVAAQITGNVNSMAVTNGIQGMLAGQPVNMPAEQAAAAASALSQRVVADIQLENRVQGMNNQMVPMMLVLASYVGAMIMGMNMEQSAMAVSGTVGRWQRFAVRSSINVVAALLVALVGASLIVAFGGQIENGFMSLWLFQSPFLLTFMFVAQAFLYLFGMAGMLFNIIMLSLQLVSSGAMVPRELLSDFYIRLGELLPATYAVEGLMNILFGGPSIGADAGKLAIIVVAAIAVSVLAVSLKRQPGGQLRAAAVIHSKK